MNERRDLGRILSDIELQMKELEIGYEQYFAGVEKREPMLGREALAKRLRHFANRRIVQTDLRFRYQNLATRFHVYCGYWDRILRLIDEGRYSRQLGALPKAPPLSETDPAGQLRPPATPPASADVDAVFDQLVAAHLRCDLQPPARHQVENYLARQQDLIRAKFGDRPIEFHIETAGGKPKLKIKAKR